MATNTTFTKRNRAGGRAALFLLVTPFAAIAAGPAAAPARPPTAAPVQPPATPAPPAPVPANPAPPAPTPPASPSPGVAPVVGPRPKLGEVNPPITTPFSDKCKIRGCQPKIQLLKPAVFGRGTPLTITGVDFGNGTGHIRMNIGGTQAELPVLTWQPTQIVAGFAGVKGVPGGQAQIVVMTTDGSTSNGDVVTFNPNLVTYQVSGDTMRVDSCSGGTSSNQCNKVHVGEAPIGYCDSCLGAVCAGCAPPAMAGYHYDHCTNLFCLNGPSGSDRYSIGPLANGYKVGLPVAKLMRCGNVDKNGKWQGDTNLKQCTVSVRKLNPEDDRGTFSVDFLSDPKIDMQYVVTLTIQGPEGLSP